MLHLFHLASLDKQGVVFAYSLKGKLNLQLFAVYQSFLEFWEHDLCEEIVRCFFALRLPPPNQNAIPVRYFCENVAFVQSLLMQVVTV